MVGRSAAALIKRAQTLAAKGDDSTNDLAEVVWELRALPKPPDGDRPTLDELASHVKLSGRTICYLLKVWQAFSGLGMARERLVEVGWTKAAVSVIENCATEEVEEALAMAETATAKELPALLKGAGRKPKARTVQLRLTPRQYDQFAAVLLANGARRSRGERGLSGKERALMKALGH